MKVSSKGVDLILKYEGFQDKAYLCPAGKWTIGYGTTVIDGKAVKKGDTITKEKARKIAELQIEQHASTIFNYVTVPLTQNQYDALASFQYNCGKYILSKDKTLVNHLNNREWEKACEQLKKYNKGGGKVLAGLTKRRQEEVSLFLAPDKRVEQPPVKQLTVDGYWGPSTTRRICEVLGITPVDKIVGQSKNAVTNNIIGVEFGVGGSPVIKALQKLCGATSDGYLGPKTLMAMQSRYGTKIDGVLSTPSSVVKALQRELNRNRI